MFRARAVTEARTSPGEIRRIILDQSKLHYSVSYNAANKAASSFVQNGDVKLRGNTVTVTVSYDWIPEALLGSGVTLSSTSVMPMSY